MEHLSVVGIVLLEGWNSLFEYPSALLERRGNVWKKFFIDILRDSTSEDHKFPRWRIARRRSFQTSWRYDVVEKGELEAFPETFL